jgi:hypothetical protein
MLNLSDDFAKVADGLESVTLLRRGSVSDALGIAIAHALRRTMTLGELAIVKKNDVHKAVASDGRATATDLIWLLPIAELPELPRLGDIVLDGDGHRWTILEVQRMTRTGRWSCKTRNVAIAYGLDDTIAVLKATYGKSDGGAAEPTWQVWKTGIRARIQPLETEMTTDVTMHVATRRYRIFVEEDMEVDSRCCIRGPDGTLYTITSSIGVERIGEVQVIEAEVTQ